MISCIIILLNFIFKFKINKNMLKISKKNSTKIISIGQLIKLILKNKIRKLWIGNNKQIICLKKNIHKIFKITNIKPILEKQLIKLCIKKKINFVFCELISNNIIKNTYNNILFILNNILFPILEAIILLLTIIIMLNIIQKYSDFDFNKFQNYKFDKNITIYNKQLPKYNINNIKYNISLKSWVGSPEVFEECYEVISYIKNSSNYKLLGAELPKGILLEGPPGVGKTLLAKAIASETNSTFISVPGSEFVEIFVGVGAKRIRNLFEFARNNIPTIIFIDEIDAIGKKRENTNFNGNDEREQTLNQLLTEMDGFNNNDGILILAATNRKEILDKALLRPGRFDRIINIPLPDLNSRTQIINLYLKNKKYIESTIDINLLAELTNGYSGADLKNVINEAAILAARLGLKKITNMNILNALEKNLVGIIKNTDTRTNNTKLRISYHEIGHAFLVIYYSKYFDLQKISIKSTYSGAGGYTLFNEKIEYKDGGLYTKDMLFKRLIIIMGGKAAESIWYGNEEISLGATQDLKQANQLARKMIGLFGMGNDLETFYNQDLESELNYGTTNKYSEKTKEMFDNETIKLVSESFIEAKNIINKNKEIFQRLSELLITKQILIKSDLKYFYKNINNDY